MWTFNNKPFTSDDIGSNLAFVYIITNLTNQRKYIGMKGFYSNRTLPALKDQKRKRKIVKPSDWQTYNGSNNELIEDINVIGLDNIHKEILHLCQTRSHSAYLELMEQINRQVLFKEDYYNKYIQVRIASSHVKSLDAGSIRKSVNG